ncbi:hypothetical protein TWF694_007656 [Orbilia ellipsospora]|uniref:tyrosinase n=1 Tax=Orbilia ellipsospora TaxID=2528407 RepID=A0AAV9XIV8_9PEZI
MSSGHYIVTGIKIPGQKPAYRKDVDVWYDSEDEESRIQVSLYIQALSFFQKIDYTDEKSYFRIAAIHGKPRVPWGDTTHENKQKNFCSHAQVTFPTWHRPYLALYEQRLHEIMIDDIIGNETFPESKKAEWTAAANKWRLPYWDYAHNPRIAKIAEKKYINILDQNKEDDEPTKVLNPMWSYRLFDKDGKPITMGKLGEYSIEDGYQNCHGTSRHVIPGSKDWGEGFSNSSGVTDLIANPRALNPTKGGLTIENFVGRLLARDYFKSWRPFASTRYVETGEGQEWLSLEQIHNYIHGATAGSFESKTNGHMGNPTVSAFDPIFWIHHCFIDRLCAIWQLVPGNDEHWFDNPEKPPSQGPKPHDIKTKLYPFRKNEIGDYYNSADCEHWTEFGYDYEDTDIEKFKQGLSGGDTSRELYRNINSLYGSERRDFLGMFSGSDAAGLVAGGAKFLPKDLKYDYVVNVIYDRYAINNGESYTIHLFIGDIDETQAFASQESYVGCIFNFSSPYDTSGCQNCREQAEENIHCVGQVPLTRRLLDDLQAEKLDAFDPERIANYLEEGARFKVRVRNSQGADVPLATLEPTFKVAVFAGSAEYSFDDEVLPRYEGHTVIWCLTPQQIQEGNQQEDYERLFGTMEA